MPKKINVLAFDFGASSGRAVMGEFDGERITLTELHRFSNDPVYLNGTLYWDVLRLFYEIKQGIVKAKCYSGFESIGIDTWGVDFALIDRDGALIENPVHYRDSRTGLIEKPNLYDKTGIQYLHFNTAYQLKYLAKKRPDTLKRADKLLFLPDYFNYLLTGVKSCEYSIASTSAMLDGHTKDWSDEVVDWIGLDRGLLCSISGGGRVLGQLSDDISEELMVNKVKVISVCGHDTACAVVAVPTQETDFLYLSCGTWSLMGTQLDNPIFTSQSITNEGGYDGKIRYLKNITGLWMIQSCRRRWEREGRLYSYPELEQLARAAKGERCYIDTNAPQFSDMGNIPKLVQEYCKSTNQYIPKTVGEVTRCIYESLAKEYAKTKVEIEQNTHKTYNTIHMVGGGIRDSFLCELTQQYCGCRVIAGPVEATAMGNIALQLIALGEIKDLNQAKRIIKASAQTFEYCG